MKIAIVYWSSTGNTAAMAQAVAEGATGAGAEVELVPCAGFDDTRVADFDAIGFGCPAMGAEVLEETEFEPLFSRCLPGLAGKLVGLFGSYGWGDGEWMRQWEQTCADAGVRLVSEGVICCGYPDETALEQCQALGRALATAA